MKIRNKCTKKLGRECRDAISPAKWSPGLWFNIFIHYVIFCLIFKKTLHNNLFIFIYYINVFFSSVLSILTFSILLCECGGLKTIFLDLWWPCPPFLVKVGWVCLIKAIMNHETEYMFLYLSYFTFNTSKLFQCGTNFVGVISGLLCTLVNYYSYYL